MPIIDPLELDGVTRPELVFALVSPIGTPLDELQSIFEKELADVGYETRPLRLSAFLDGFELPTAMPRDGTAFERLWAQMNRGDELRDLMGGGEALALLAAADIWDARPPGDRRVLEGMAHLLRQLKHPDEVMWLRKIYGRALHLVGVFCPEQTRERYLVEDLHMSEDEARRLIKRDNAEKDERGQHVARTFHLSDLFIEMRGRDNESAEDVATQLGRYLSLLFGTSITTPTRDEYGMFLAQAAALRSADLSRQVGAAVLSERGDVLSIGCNEVPAPGGGQYWGGEERGRDKERGYDANEKKSWECLREVIEKLDPDLWASLDEGGKEERVQASAEKLKDARLMSLTEFGRSVHAEMEAIVGAGRCGRSLRSADLYTTVFPCHNCAKHIVCAGIRKVVYIEPYPKSLAADLHDDSICTACGAAEERRVVFEPFRGVALRMYPALFSILSPEGRRLKRKERGGDVAKAPLGLRLSATAVHYIDREALAASVIKSILESEEAMAS